MSRWMQYGITMSAIAALAMALLMSAPRGALSPDYRAAKTLYDPFEEAPGPFRKFLWLDGEWQFRLESDNRWHKVAVPHVWNSIPGLENYSGRARYRLEFEFPEGWKGSRIVACFGGVTGSVEVWMNGKKAGVHHGTFSAFEVELTRQALFAGKNALELIVDNRPNPAHPPYPIEEKAFGGIFREAYIEQRKAAFVENINAEAVMSESATAQVRVTARLNMGTVQSAHVFCKIQREDKRAGAMFEQTVTAEKGVGLVDWSGLAGGLQSWTVDDPVMFRVSMIVMYGNGEMDGLAGMFGIRSLSLDAGGLVINGKPERLRGVVWREQFPIGWGPVMNKDMIEKDFKFIAASGFNAVRLPHPAHPAVLDFCDREGIFVVEEFPLWKELPQGGAESDFEDELAAGVSDMVIRDRRHPSIVAWGVGADLAPDDKAAAEVSARLVDVIKSLDVTRPVYVGLRGPDAKGVFSNIGDFTAYALNPGGMKGFLRGKKPLFSENNNTKPLFITSFGFPGLPDSGGNAGLQGSEEKQVFIMSEVDKAAQESGGVAAWFADSFADFEGPRRGPDPADNFIYKGIFNFNREPKMAFEYYSGQLKQPAKVSAGAFFRFPRVEFFILILAIALAAGFLAGCRAKPENLLAPDTILPSGNRPAEIITGLSMLGIPALVIAAAAASFAVSARISPALLDPLVVPENAIRAAHLWLESPGTRFFFILGVQAAWLLIAAIGISFVSGGEPVRVFELIARCSYPGAAFVLAALFPSALWLVAALAAAAEIYLISGAVSRVFSIEKATVFAAAVFSYTAVAALAAFAAYQQFGSLKFLF